MVRPEVQDRDEFERGESSCILSSLNIADDFSNVWGFLKSKTGFTHAYMLQFGVCAI